MPTHPYDAAAWRAYDYLEEAAVDLARINPGAAETAALVAVRLRDYLGLVERWPS